MANEAMIPLYLNTDILSNLFTVMVETYVDIRSTSTKDLVTVRVRSPISEFSYDIFGKYIQGDFELTLANEYVKQRTEEKISINIVVLMKLRDMLANNNLLRRIEDESSLNSIQENDYIEFNCKLKQNPILKHASNIIHDLEIQNALDNMKAEKAADIISKRNDVITLFKNGIEDCKKNKCLRYIGNCKTSSKTNFIIPLKSSSMIDSEGYMINGRVSILGKVISVKNKNEYLSDGESAIDTSQVSSIFNNWNSNLLSHSFFDHVDYSKLQDLFGQYSQSTMNSYNMDDKLIQSADRNIEILPIAIYI